MSSVGIVLVCLTVIIVVWLLTQRRRRPAYYYGDTWWPVTWTYDWGGGHGYDRHRIMREGRDYREGPHPVRFSR